MKSIKTILLFSFVLILAKSSWSAMGSATIVTTSTNSSVSGSAKFEDTKEGLKLSVSIKNAAAGQHGFHIHEFGSCSEMGKAAGGHYNPMGHPHGNALKDGKAAHAGDMGNFDVKADGTGQLEVVIPGVTLTDGKYNVAGRALILHEKADDFGQPTGNAGGRVGCGTILIVGN